MSVIVTAVLVLLFSYLRGVELQLLLLPALFGAGIAFAIWQNHASRSVATEQIVAAIALIVAAISATTRIPVSSYSGLWAGFGVLPTATAAALSVTLLYGPAISTSFARDRTFLAPFLYLLVPLALVAPRLLLFVQPPNGLINLGDTTYHVLDELLAPYSGGFPYGDYTPQYTGVLGWLLFPMRLLPLDPETVMGTTIVISNLLNLAVPVLVVATCRLAFPYLRRTVVFSAFVALWTVCGTDLGYSSQVREFSHFARYVPALLALWLVLLAVSKLSGPQQHWTQLAAAGFAIGLAVINSADYGLALALSVFSALLLLTCRSQIPWRFITQVTAWFLLTMVIYIAISFVMRQAVSLESFLGLRSDALSGNVYGTSKQISPYGPQVLVLMIPVILIALAFTKTPIWQIRKESLAIGLLAIIVAFWSLLLLIKFLMKDPTSAVELPANFVTVFIGGLVIYGSVIAPNLRQNASVLRIQMLPILFVFSLVLGTIYPSPSVSVRDELKRISGQYLNSNEWSSTPGRNSDGWSLKALAAEDNLLEEVERLASIYQQDGRNVGYFGIFGNTVELVTGTNNVTGIASPESLRFGDGQASLSCKPLRRAQPDIVIVNNSDFPCPGYTEVLDSVRSKFKIFRRD